MAGKEVDLEACKRKVGGEEEGKKRKKSTLTVISDSPSLSTPPPSTQDHLFFNCSCQSDGADSRAKKCPYI